MVREIVAIGASLGGLEAVQTVLGGLSSSFQCPVVVVQHRLPEVDGRLIELLRARSVLPVCEPDDKQRIERGHVYLGPPGYHLVVERGYFSLSLDPPVLFARPSIDVLFESVADSYGRAAMAVMLTGSNADGAVGARAVKRAGGCVLVQDPAGARAPEAPRAVIEGTNVDAVVSLEGVAVEIMSRCLTA